MQSGKKKSTRPVVFSGLQPKQEVLGKDHLNGITHYKIGEEVRVSADLGSDSIFPKSKDPASISRKSCFSYQQ